MQKFILIFLFVLCSACNSESVKPHVQLSAPFDNSQIDRIESILRDVATNNDLKIFKKNREKMQYLSQGKNAFFTALYFKEDPVLILTNVGVANTLVFTATDYGKMPIAELERLASEVVKRIETSVNTNFEEQVSK